MAKERVQKILARAGIASRRKAEELISEGAVTVNGKVIKLGDQAEYGKDAIKVNGKLLHSTEALAYVAFNKPKGVISMFGDPQGRPSLTEYLNDVKYRLFPVGRLDFNSEGLILLTNDGDFAEKIQRRDDIVRVYHVKVGKRPTPEEIERLSRGGRVGNRMFKPHSVRLAQEFTKKAMIEVTIVGAGAVDLKAYFELKRFQIERIIRVAFGHLRLGDIEPGHFKYLKSSQAMAILEQPELGMKRQEHEEEKSEKKLERNQRREEREEAHRPRRVIYGKGDGPKKIAPRTGPAPRASDSEKPRAKPRFAKSSGYGVFQEREDRSGPRSRIVVKKRAR
jgi:23S rRNA pseudouridine2605 synthase